MAESQLDTINRQFGIELPAPTPDTPAPPMALAAAATGPSPVAKVVPQVAPVTPAPLSPTEPKVSALDSINQQFGLKLPDTSTPEPVPAATQIIPSEPVSPPVAAVPAPVIPPDQKGEFNKPEVPTVGGLPQGIAPSPPTPTPEAPEERGFLGELGASAVRGVGGVLKMPKSILGAFGIKGASGLAETGEEIEKGYAPSPSVSGGITEKPSLLVNPNWWASSMPSLAIQLIPIAIATLGGTLAAGPAGGAVGGLAAGGLIGVADAGQRMMDWEKEHDTEIPTATKILIGLGAGTAGAVLPGKVLSKLLGEGGIPAAKVISELFKGPTGQVIADRAVRAAYGGGAMAGFSVIENAFEKFGYNPDREVTQGVLESLILGTAVSGIHSEIGLARKRMAEKGESKRLDEYFGKLTLDLNDAYNEAQRVRTQYGGGEGAVVGETPAEAKPVLDQFGRPAAPDETQAALAKQPFERNAQEKLLADQALKEGGVTPVGTITTAGPRPETVLPPGARAEGTPAATVEPGIVPPAIAPPPTEVVPEAPPRTPSPPMGVAGTASVPEAAKTVPTEAKTVPETQKVIPAEAKTVPKIPDQPIDISGTAAETLGARKPPAPTITPPEIVPPAPSGEVVPGEAAPPGITEPLPPGVKEFQATHGTAGRVGPPEGLLTQKKGKGVDFQRAIERNDLASLLHNLGGIEPRTYNDYISTKEERQKLGRLIGKSDGLPVDVMFIEAKAHFPDQFGHFEDAGDMVRYFLDSRHERFLNKGDIEKQAEEHYADTEDEAKRKRVSPEGLAELEADVAREIAAERAAIRGEPGAGKPIDLKAGWPAPAESAFGLRAGSQKPTALNTRLDALQAEYPGIDREKASTVLRAFPKAENNHIAAMSTDPEMFDQVARGNLAASEKAQLLKQVTDAGAQQGLPGMGGGKTLFKVGEEAAFTKSLTTEQIQGRLEKGGNVFELGPESYPASSPYTRGWMVVTKEGHQITIQEAKDGSLKMGLGGKLGPGYEAMGVTSMEGKRISGAFTPGKTPFGLASFIEIARGEGVRTVDHELWHAIERYFLTPQELAKIAKKYGATEEERAFAYEKWKPKEAPDTVFGKIQDFFSRIIKAITGYENAEDIFAKARKGEMFERKPMERGLPETLALEKYRTTEGGEWAMEGGLTGKIVGDAKAAREEAKGLKDMFASWFYSSRTSKEALRTHQIIAGSQAESATEKTRMQNVFQKYVDTMGAIKGEATQEFLRLYESPDFHPDQINDPIFKAFGEEFRAEERRHMEIMTLLGDAPKEIPNYIDHLWAENETREQLKAQLMAAVSGGRSMRGPDYFKLLRTVVDIPSGIAAGLEPKFDTLPEMVLAGRSARENRIAATKRLNFIKENGYEKVVRDLEGGTFTVEGPDGKDQTFKSINEARKWAKDNPGSGEPRFEPDVPQGWKVYPGGYGEVWAKVQRRAGAMVPEFADENVLPLGAQRENPMAAITGQGFEEVPGVDVWTKVGSRVGPEDVVRQFQDFLGRGLSGNNAFEIYQSGLHAIRHSQMALSLFHAFAESINSVATHAGEGVFESLGGLFTGDWRRAAGGLKTLGMASIAPFTDLKLSMNIDKELMKYGVGIPGEVTDNSLLKLGREVVAGGHRPRAETDLIKILSQHFKEAFKLKGDLALGHRGNELLQGLSSPTMEVIVPFMKGGSNAFKYLAEVRRWERNHPDQTPTVEDLRNIAYETGRISDAIFGQMARDNVGMSAMLKSLLTGVLQFPTWQFGTVTAGVRSVIGAKDVVGKVFDMMQGKEIRQLVMKDRLALQYVTGLIFSVGLVGGLMNWAMTGKKPETMADYFFPKTGEINPNGSEERLQLPSYFKDAMGVSHHPFKTIGAKLASPIHILTDLIANKDYWGNMVYDPNDWIGQRGIDVLKYMAKTTAPFALQSFDQGAKQTPGRAAMSLFGVRPVPRETSNTEALNVIDQYNQQNRATMTSKEAAEERNLKVELRKLAGAGDEEGFKEAARAAMTEGKLTRQQIKTIVDESQAPPGIGRFIGLPVEWQVRTWQVATPEEKETWRPYFLKKVQGAKPEILIRNRDTLVPVLDEMGLPDAADTIRNLTISEKAAQFDFAAMGIRKPAPELKDMDTVDTSIMRGIKAQAEKEGEVKAPKKLSLKEKKRPYAALGF
jgi:hypothetical protein